MKKKDLKDLRHSKDLKELFGLEKKTAQELARLKIDLKADKLKKTHVYYLKKRDFARIKTAIKERQLHEKT